MDESKHEIHSQVDAITAGTASVVNLTAGRLHAELTVRWVRRRASVCKHEYDRLGCDCTLTHGRDSVTSLGTRV